ncbi:MAG: hypothetical protein HN352_05560 [Bacteroidetes bacterium]|nr:hypothetical protein [Bacteroidota bacterium]MBT4399660.1 hypothetical protein [Bacteroidota bacterium]MBT4409547.1 hypothetical protein [Bacteroidota bacterium]MBT7464195.1 hypothetical protein [Bacteroidota bacterium]
MIRKATLILFLFIFCSVLGVKAQQVKATSSGLKFSISFDKSVHQSDITGRVYLMISKNNRREPKNQVGLTGVPFWGMNVEKLAPGDQAFINDQVFGYPLESISEIPAGEYYIQGFINVYTEFKRSDGHTLWMHKDNWEGQNWRRGEGNLFSNVKKVYLDPSKSEIIKLICNNSNPAVEIPDDSKMVKRVRIKSKLLSDFWGQPMYLGATVLLPDGYDENPDEFYPVNYQHGHFSLGVPFGFRDPDAPSASSRRSNQEFTDFWMSDDCPPLIAIKILHPCPYYDDSYAVNSPNVGPYDDAIAQELIPLLEEKFRIISQPYARILSGGSTGGWIALAQQIFHPDFYGGVFSLCADPVDFHYYQIVDIYKDKNAYYRENEWFRVERPNTRSTDGNIRTTMANENLYELVVGDKNRSGGQWDIWEAAYSPIGPDGYPMRVWDKRTGEINHAVAEQWKNYDLHEYLKNNWSVIGNDLKGKLFLYTGDMDSFYLNNAMELLEGFLKETKDPYFDGHIEYGRKKPHCYGPRGIELVKMIADQVNRNVID